MRQSKVFLLVAIVLSLLVTVGCSKNDNDNNGRITINNNQDSFQSRIQYSSDVMPVEGQNGEKTFGFRSERGNFSLTLRAEVASPVYNGKTLQATHVKIVGNYAYVTYNSQYSDYLGGVEVFDVSDTAHPVIVSQALFNDTDIASVSYNNNRLYLAEASDVDHSGFTYPAAVEEVTLSNNLLTNTTRRVGVKSYVSTDIANVDGNVLVTSGDNGGLTLLSENSMQEVDFKAINAAKAVDYNNQYIVAMEGTGSKLYVFARDTHQLVSTINLGGALDPEAKSDMEVYGNKVFVAAGAAGTKMVDLTNPSSVQTIPIIVAPAGVNPIDLVTNAVSVTDDIVFMANGGSGVSVAALVGTNSIQRLGNMDFGASVNFVEASGNIIFVAAGTGGLKILEKTPFTPENGGFAVLDPNDPTPWDDEGTPNAVDPTQDIITDDFWNRITSTLPEDVHVPDALLNRENEVVITQNNTYLWVTFIHEGADWKNSFGYYVYNTGSAPANAAAVPTPTIIFPNVSYVNSGGGLRRGDRVRIGPFNAGQTVGYFLIARGWNSTTHNVTTGLYIHYTSLLANEGLAPSLRQHNILLNDPVTGKIIVTFEDILRSSSACDHDFNDAIMMITPSSPGAIDVSNIPNLNSN